MDEKERKAALVQLFRFMTATEVAEHFGVDSSVVRRACIQELIPARKSGSTWIIRRADAFDRWGNKSE